MSNEHREQAREIRFPFPCGCMDAHEGGGMAVEEYTCAAHHLIAEALSSRDAEVREVLVGLIAHRVRDREGNTTLHWCKIESDGYFECCAECSAARDLYSKLQAPEVQEGLGQSKENSSVD